MMDGREAEIVAVTDQVNSLLDDLLATVAALNAILHGVEDEYNVPAGEDQR